jgi:hypothetical protein
MLFGSFVAFLIAFCQGKRIDLIQKDQTFGAASMK